MGGVATPINQQSMSGGGPIKGPSGSQTSFPYCPEIGKYEKLAKVGQGTFGEVFKARDRKNGRIVALKKVRMENEKEGFPMTALREIRILQLLNHVNIVSLVEICRAKATPYNRDRGTIYLVFEFCEHDLAGLLECKEVHFSLSEIKLVVKQLFNALSYIHGNSILHRDMKSSNVLITRTGQLKLCDFGLARALHKTNQRYTNRVVTLWYRPPELILGDRTYGPPVDIWGAGCIMAEMWTRRPIMQGDTEQKQISLISQLCGSITTENWPGVEKLEYFPKLELPAKENRKLRERLRHFVEDPYALDLIERLLVLDPKKRIDADSTLEHDFFWKDPLPTSLGRTLSSLRSSMFVMHTGSQRPLGARVPPQSATSGHIHDRVF